MFYLFHLFHSVQTVEIQGFSAEQIRNRLKRLKRGDVMFGKKKANLPIHAMHYEGINSFPTDFPCTIQINDDIFVIKRVNPETTVELPLNRIMAFSSMAEENFMLKYHGQAVNTSKAKGIKKYYLVVEYDKGILAFWGTAKEYGEFNKLQYLPLKGPSHIEL